MKTFKKKTLFIISMNALLVFSLLPPAAAADCNENMISKAIQAHTSINVYSQDTKYLQESIIALEKHKKKLEFALTNCKNYYNHPVLKSQANITIHNLEKRIIYIQSLIVPTPTPSIRPSPTSSPKQKSNNPPAMDILETIKTFFISYNANQAFKELETLSQNIKGWSEKQTTFDSESYYNKEFVFFTMGLLYKASSQEDYYQKAITLVKDILYPIDVAKYLPFKTIVEDIIKTPESLQYFLNNNLDDLIKLLHAIDKSEPESRIRLKQIIFKLASSFDKDDYELWQELILFVDNLSSSQERELWKKFLPNLQIANIKELIREVALFKKEERIPVLFDPFKLTDSYFESVKDIKHINMTIKTLLQERFELTDTTTSKAVFLIQGKISRKEDAYNFSIDFLTNKSKLFIFSDLLETGLEKNKIDLIRLKKQMQAILSDFDKFLNSLRTIALASSEYSLAYTEGVSRDKIEAIISSQVITQSKIHSAVTQDLFTYERMNGVYIDGSMFWEKNGKKDIEADKILGSDYKGLITAHINKSYLLDKPNVFLTDLPTTDTFLKISGEYWAEVDLPGKDNHCQVDILYKIKDIFLRKDSVFIQKKLLKNDLEAVNNYIAELAGKGIADFFLLQKRLEPKLSQSRPDNKLQKNLVVDFFMPGYTSNYVSKKNNALMHMWNYTNLALLSTTLITETIYIGSGYKQELQPLYTTGLICVGTFLINGLIGVLVAIPEQARNTTIR